MGMVSLLQILAVVGVACACKPRFGPGQHILDMATPDDPTAPRRRWLLYVPKNADYDQVGGVPAVVAFHGFQRNPWNTLREFGIETLNEDHDPRGAFAGTSSKGFNWIWALPFGWPAAPVSDDPSWCCPEAVSPEECSQGNYTVSLFEAQNACKFNSLVGGAGVDDVGFAKLIATYLSTEMCVGADRVFAMGNANGGAISNRCGCEGGGAFRGISAFEGSVVLDGSATCPVTAGTSAIQWCAVGDTKCYPDFVGNAVEMYRERNNCTGEATPSFRTASMSCTAYTECTDGAFVERCDLLDLPSGLYGDSPIPVYAVPGSVSPGDEDDSTMLQPASTPLGPQYALRRFSSLL